MDEGSDTAQVAGVDQVEAFAYANTTYHLTFIYCLAAG